MLLFIVPVGLLFLPTTYSQCFDLAIDCASKNQLCLNKAWASTMNTYCAVTCGLCSGTSGAVTTPAITTAAATSAAATTAKAACVDLAITCRSQSALCFNAAYKSLMTKQCGATCGFC